ncbi:rCG55811 [Rattus norvegicus]|uniref:RCG55811 n=1 Tax=Rattus norvegicus TaxID=10116 RepID=A6JLV8_RAT|nr:rCG55811 [Rattus norvegicus]
MLCTSVAICRRVTISRGGCCWPTNSRLCVCSLKWLFPQETIFHLTFWIAALKNSKSSSRELARI